MTDLPKKHCRYCGVEFQAVRRHQQNCSKDHRMAWHKARINMGKKLFGALDESGYDAHVFFTTLRDLLPQFKEKYPSIVDASYRAMKESME